MTDQPVSIYKLTEEEAKKISSSPDKPNLKKVNAKYG